MTKGDVVIRVTVSGAMPVFALSCVPGPDQFECLTRGEATRLAEDYAREAMVNVWLVDATAPPRVIARYRVVTTAAADPARP